VLTRREAIGVFASVGALAAQSPAPAPGAFTLPALPYAVDSLEPFIDAQTMQIHHDRHHAAYVNNLNNALATHPELAKQGLDSLLKNLSAVPDSIRTAVRNNGGGHANHSLYWETLKKNNGAAPKGALAKAIDASFGSFQGFQDQFAKAAMGVFGSGWAWVTLGDGGKLSISGSSNQDNPWMTGQSPLFCIDVWEHAYYLKYQNRRADYVTAFYSVIDWDFVAGRLAKFSKG
jgi:superoxide dismutase, Fe-Mn family